MFFFSCLILFLFILIGIAFFTLLERKILSYVQSRSGPFKVGMLGLFQPFGDALKLFSKEFNYFYFGNYVIFYFMPFLMFIFSLIYWLMYIIWLNFISFELAGLFLFSLLGFSVYFTMISGWSSMSIYSLLGGMRSISQSISYEVSFYLVFILFFFIMGGFNFILFYYFQIYIWFLFFFFPLFFIFFSSVLAESNRSPFDFSEGESELVSGFNVEYSSIWFSLFFLSEYGLMMFMSFIGCLMFFCSDLYSFIYFLKVVFLSFLFIWIRSCFPRFRYDKLMILNWKLYLPICLNMFFCFLIFVIYIYFINFSKK
uniref:NADH dehydrogenase subunit 1 n=1 Tax=Nisia atrovenosa TaxID=1187023 RepID=UPI002A835C3A|nr:NADH dehydrogenase subunit 1 [Nisia atrovenosa]WOW98930.1 NADH dehydrogenase subunit 1 [Nisia atrovenosa]